jgi:hypothetical protein
MTPLDQQISESRDLFKHLLHRYAWLANTFALLAPMVNDKRLKDRFSKSKELSEAASPVARALFNSCVVDVCTLVLDHEQEKINPSLRRLVRPFLPQHGARDPKLLKRFATLCSKNETRRLFRAHAKQWAQYLTEDWGLVRPEGLAVLGNTLFVANNGNGTVGKYDAKTGAAINAAFITGLSSPEGLGRSVKSAK